MLLPQLSSLRQSAEQPSQETVLPSSHTSSPATMPSPHTTGVQTSAWQIALGAPGRSHGSPSDFP